MKHLKTKIVFLLFSTCFVIFSCKSSKPSKGTNPKEQKLTRNINWENQWRHYLAQNWLYDAQQTIKEANAWFSKKATETKYKTLESTIKIQQYLLDINDPSNDITALTYQLKRAGKFLKDNPSFNISDQDFKMFAFTRDYLKVILEREFTTRGLRSITKEKGGDYEKEKYSYFLKRIENFEKAILEKKVFSGKADTGTDLEDFYKFDKSFDGSKPTLASEINVLELERKVVEGIDKALLKITKPINVAELIEKVDKAIEKTPNETAKLDPISPNALDPNFIELVVESIQNFEAPSASMASTQEAKKKWVQNERENTQSIIKLQQFKRYVIFGDSLTDFGSMLQKMIAGKTRKILTSNGTGLHKRGIFSDGHNWASYLYTRLVHAAYIKMSPNILTNNKNVIQNLVKKILADSTYRHLKIGNKNPILNYAEGGASTDTGTELMGAILKTLSDERRLFLNDEKVLTETKRQELSKETLFFQMLGANDFITVNKAPTKEIAKAALEVSIESFKRLRKLDYHHFTYAVIPDLSLSPGFQAKTSAEQIEGHKLVQYLNQGYYDFIQLLKKEGNNDHLTVKIFDFNNDFLAELLSVKNIKARMSCLGIHIGELENGLKGRCPKLTPEELNKYKKDIKFYDASHPSEAVYKSIAGSLIRFLQKEYAGRTRAEGA